MNGVELILHRPKVPNFIRQGIFAALTAICILGMVFFFFQKPQSDFEKIFCVCAFSFFSVSLAFTSTSLINAVRNIFSKPTVILDDDKITVFREGEIALSDIKDMQANKKALLFTLADGRTVKIKRAIINIPTETLRYAVNYRK